MDWKIPATIIILAFVVGLGILPIFSPDFNGQVTDQFGSFGDIFDEVTSTQKAPQYEENVQFSMSVKDFPAIKTGIPVTLFINSTHRYDLRLDSKNLSLKGPLTMTGFIGDIDPKTGKISGSADSIASDTFSLDGKTSISMENPELDEISASGLMISDFTAKNGVLMTTRVQNKTSEMRVPLDNDGARVQGFKGSIKYSDSTYQISGTSSIITATGLTLGITQIK
jgi:hypothetical protein